MTTMEIIAVHPDGNMTLYGEASNSWGGAMHIWMKLAQQYSIPMSFSEDGFKKLWRSITIMTIPDQWVMASTFDGCIVPKESIQRLIREWKYFARRYPSETLQEALRVLDKALHDDEVQGIAFNHTSVVDGWGVWSEEGYNVNRDEKHWYLNDAYIKKIKEK